MHETIARLQLIKTSGIGRVTFFHLLKTFKTAEKAIEALPSYLKYNKKYIIPCAEEIQNFLYKCKTNNIKLVFFDQKEYPQELLTTFDYPPLLYCKGNIQLLNQPTLAIIGSRNASLQAKAFTKRIINDLHGFKIISGFAKGIDTTSHEAALKEGTIAVFGCGVNNIYPLENELLYQKILENNGLILSEIGIDEPPKPNFFSYRNRLISGISKGVLVIEAGKKSGSLITTEYALEQGRPVFAVPSHPFDPKSIGTNYLIKNGAILTRNAKDVLDELNIYKTNNITSLFNGVEENNEDIEEIKKVILKNTPYNQILIKDLVNNLPYKIQHINAALAQLELENKIIIEYCYLQKYNTNIITPSIKK